MSGTGLSLASCIRVALIVATYCPWIISLGIKWALDIIRNEKYM